MNKLFKRNGFTLAEVLITLAVIGIVAAMTIPSLMTKHRKNVIVKQMKTNVALFNEGFRQILAEEGELSLNLDWATDVDALKKLMLSHFKIERYCEGKYTPCWAAHYKYLSGWRTQTTQSRYPCEFSAILMNGASVCVERLGENDYDDILTVDLDVNGTAPPNIFGGDVITFHITKEGTVVDRAYEEGGFQPSEVYTGALGKVMADGWKMTWDLKSNGK